ncbi:MAG TPA: tetratricopeptide repeat protein [Thermomicrobiales bacterium]|nr:tetratricopeptide repeat protein [Thermomicrobiales bacterium]
MIDNMEQVIDAAPLLAELLAACPHLTILATRRRVLRLSGERDVPVPALEVPRAGDKLALDALGLVPSVHLFVERARGLVPDFELSGSNAGTIAAICRRLQGVPLAIELAAARSNLLSPAQLLTRLEQPLNLLTVAARDTPARHHTMRDVIAWSYDLLSAEDRALFRRLSVLVGSFSLEAAETIGAAGGEPVPDVLAGLGTLVDASLIKRIEARSGARMEMLQIVREYGLERLVESGEEVAVRRPHASYVLDQARQADQGWTGEEGGVWLARLSNDLDNTRAALDWLWSSDQYASGLELGSAMFRFWERTFLWREGRDWLERFLEHEETASPDVRMNALHGAGWLTLRLGDFDRARALAHESLAVGREHGLGLGPEALFFLLAGAVADERGDHHTAEAHFKDMLRTTRELGLTCATCAALSNLGTNAERVGDFASARTWYQQAVAFQREHHLWLPFDAVLPSLALVHMQLGERNEAARCLTEYLELICHLDVDPAGDVLVFLAIAFEQWLLAAQLIGFAIEHAAAQQRDPFWVTADSDTVDRELLRVKDQLGDSEFAVAVEKGRRLTRQQVIETARLLVHDTHLEQLDTEPDFRPSF